MHVQLRCFRFGYPYCLSVFEHRALPRMAIEAIHLPRIYKLNFG